MADGADLRWRVEPLDRTARWHLPLARGWSRLRRTRRLRRFLRPVWLRRLARALPGGRRATLVAVFEDGTRFAFPCHDRYWGKRLLSAEVYEPELLALLRRLRSLPYRFLDCGANFGYWSALVSGAGLGAHPALAVEGAPDTYRGLCLTAALNGHRFTCLQAAVVGRPRPRVEFTLGGDHYGRHLVGTKGWVGDRGPRVSVPAVTLDSLLTDPRLADGPVLVKLDVEGAEAEILAESGLFARRDVALVFEDHGGEGDWRALRLVLARGWRAFRMTGDGLHPVRRPEDFPRVRVTEESCNFLALPAGGGPFADALSVPSDLG